MKQIAWPLWGSKVVSLELDPTAMTIDISLELNLNDTPEGMSDHRLRFVGVRKFEYLNEAKGPWAYSDLTGVYLTQPERESGPLTVEILLWSEDTTVRVEADQLEIDGASWTKFE